jgi:hypothetical protein
MEKQEISITLTVAQWNVVMSAIGKIPLEVGIEVFSAIRAQADAALGVQAPSEKPAE